jgi:hypothetical protein
MVRNGIGIRLNTKTAWHEGRDETRNSVVGDDDDNDDGRESRGKGTGRTVINPDFAPLHVD